MHRPSRNFEPGHAWHDPYENLTPSVARRDASQSNIEDARVAVRTVVQVAFN